MNLQDAESLIGAALGGTPSGAFSTALLTRTAGQILYGMRPWKFRERLSKRLNVRGPITITGATWHESTLTLEKTGGFASYVHVPGDVLYVTTGANATVGYYGVASKTDDDNLVLDSSIGAAADSDTDIGGTLTLSRVALPEDFGELLEVTQVTYGELVASSPEEIMLRQMTDYPPSSPSGMYAVEFAGSPPRAVLMLWPAPAADVVGALALAYRVRWVDPATDSAPIPIPHYAEALFIEVLKAVALGYEEADEAMLEQRLRGLAGGVIYQQAVQSDSGSQRNYGRIRGGAVARLSERRPYGYPVGEVQVT